MHDWKNHSLSQKFWFQGPCIAVIWYFFCELISLVKTVFELSWQFGQDKWEILGYAFEAGCKIVGTVGSRALFICSGTLSPVAPPPPHFPTPTILPYSFIEFPHDKHFFFPNYIYLDHIYTWLLTLPLFQIFSVFSCPAYAPAFATEDFIVVNLLNYSKTATRNLNWSVYCVSWMW